LGEVKLQGFNGNISSGKIILLNARLVGHDVHVPLRCVVCQNVSQDCLLSLADYRKLLQGQEIHSVGVTPETFVDDVESVPVSQSSDISMQHANDIVTDDNIINHVNGDAHDTLALSQVNVESDVLSLDDSLSTADLTRLVAKQVSCVKNGG